MAERHEKDKVAVVKKHNQEFIKQEDDHLKRVFKEREQHLELYNIKPKYENALEKIW
jgi:hypothetical protein